MAIRDIIGLILSIFVAGVMIWACSFDIQQIMIGELVTAAGGKYQFLTILNLVTKVYNVMLIFILNLASTSDLL
jgi:hypothetical protein